MCKAITKSGKVCKIKSETHFCHIHQDHYNGFHGVREEPTIEEKREAALEKLFFTKHDTSFFIQQEAWPLFKGLDFTSETLVLINRAKYVCDWSEETYNTVISTFFDDSVDEDTKYCFFKQTMSEGMNSKPTKDHLKNIQRMDLYKDVTVNLTKIALSRGIYWEGLVSAKIIINALFKVKKHDIEEYRENNLKKLRVKAVEKHTPICDDVRKYIIAQYL
jgi:hypothetical protein